jgi:hypothetical protein
LVLEIIREKLERRALIHILIALICHSSVSYVYIEWNNVITSQIIRRCRQRKVRLFLMVKITFDEIHCSDIWIFQKFNLFDTMNNGKRSKGVA